jgi:prolyl 4-hydroxylase
VVSEQWIEQLSWHPRAWLYHNFLSKEECEYLISKARPEMERSGVVDNVSGKNVDSECASLSAPRYSTVTSAPRIRTSSGMFFKRGQDATIAAIEDRIAGFAMIPVGVPRCCCREAAALSRACRPRGGDSSAALSARAEVRGTLGVALQLGLLSPLWLQAHYDYFHDQLNIKNGGQRVATVLLYLCASFSALLSVPFNRSPSSNVEEGGETVFPAATDGASPETGEHSRPA